LFWHFLGVACFVALNDEKREDVASRMRVLAQFRTGFHENGQNEWH
jgi:hypothetical protein